MKEKVVVFIEKVEKNKKYLLLDFPVNNGNVDYFQNFLAQTNSDLPSNEDSMLEIENITFENDKAQLCIPRVCFLLLLSSSHQSVRFELFLILRYVAWNCCC